MIAPEGADLAAARDELKRATAAAKQAAAQMAKRGASEYTIAAELGVDRGTVRRWLGR